MTPPPDEHWITVEEAATEASVSRRTIYNWIHGSKLVWKRTVGGSIRILPGSLWGEHSNREGWRPNPNPNMGGNRRWPIKGEE